MSGGNGIRKLRLGGAMLVVFGLVPAALGGATYLQTADERSNAVETTGTVVGTRIVTDPGIDSPTTYEARVYFEYTADGTRYRSFYYYPSATRTFDSRADARSFLADYEVGSSVSVRYPSDDPGEGFLRPGPSPLERVGITLGVAAVLLALGASLVAFAPRIHDALVERA